MRTTLGWVVCVMMALSATAWGMNKGAPFPEGGGLTSTALPNELKDVGIDQKLGNQIPLDLVFRDENGQAVRLGELMGGKKPVVLTLVYYECPMLCTVVLNDLVRTLKLMDLSVGKDFTVLTVSFNPAETAALAAKKKEGYLRQYKREGAEAGWHFLTGDADAIAKLTDAAGFRYVYDARNKQYLHASGIMVLTPEGRLSRYFFGIEYAPKDVSLALVQASDSRIGSVADRILLYCFHYDPASGRYTLAVARSLKVGATLLIVGLGVMLLMLSRGGSAGAAATARTADDGSPSSAASGDGAGTADGGSTRAGTADAGSARSAGGGEAPRGSTEGTSSRRE